MRQWIKTGGRLMYTKGPVILALETVQLLTGLLALAALCVAILSGRAVYHDVQQERYDSSLNTCYAIRHITFAAYTPKYQLQAQAVLRQAGLGDCVGSARSIIGHPPNRTAYAPARVSPHPPGWATQPPPGGRFRLAAPQPTLEMFDSIVVSTVPANPRAVAGYTSGFWPTFIPLVQAFPHALHVSIAINTSHVADCLDVEPGDASPAQAAGWVRWMLSLGHRRPCLYSSVSEFQTVNADIAGAGLSGQIRRWCAWYRYRPGLIVGCDAVQWTDHAYARNLDQSTVALSFFNLTPPPPPDPYRIYDKTVRHFGAAHASEHNTTRTWDRARCRNPARGGVCRSSHAHLVLLRDRLYAVAHRNGQGVWGASANWGSYHRGARFQGLQRRLHQR